MTSLGTVFWILLAATAAVYVTMLVWTLPAIAAAAGGLAPFDLRPLGYSVAETRAFIDALSDEGRAIYLGPQHMLDTAYPPLLAVTLALAFHLLVPRRLRVLRAVLISLPFVAGAFDLLENLRVRALLSGTPETVTETAVTAASQATLAKSMLSSVAFAALFLALAAALARRWRA